MARPTTKPELIRTANEQFDKLLVQIGSMTKEEQSGNFNFGDDFLQKQKEAHWKRDNNLRDVLVHLYEWHKLLLSWVHANKNGDIKPFIPAPYNWKTYGEMNVKFWKNHQSTSLDNAMRMFEETFHEVMKTIDGFSNEELFTKGIFSWTGTSTLGSYCVSATSSHYDWAMKKIKAYGKAYKGTHTG